MSNKVAYILCLRDRKHRPQAFYYQRDSTFTRYPEFAKRFDSPLSAKKQLMLFMEDKTHESCWHTEILLKTSDGMKLIETTADSPLEALARCVT